MEIAIYGKGGIGKSTISANLSAALALEGRRVLQIGCDPKHDSTRLLHHGQQIETVLNYLLVTAPENQDAHAVLTEGFGGVGCIEAGGPKPGMGCAGRGILTAFEFLNRFQLKEQYDEVIYDVLGDVVCGGFAVPVRKQYANAVFLVTSGEFMALYAANNILQGIRNLDENEMRIAGVIFNSRNIAGEAERVRAFAEAVDLPVYAEIPRSDAFAAAEREAITVLESDRNSSEASVFVRLARDILKGLPLFSANPLSEEEMEQFMRGDLPAVRNKKLLNHKGEIKPSEGKEAPAEPEVQSRSLADPFSRVPLFGCAFNGAIALSIHIRGASVFAHAPKSCVWFSNNGFSAYGRRGIFNRGVLYPVFSPVSFDATDINAQDVVFGGTAHMREKLLSLTAQRPQAVIAVTACIPGLTGDDLSVMKPEMDALGVPLIIVKADGVEAGDYNAGMALCYREIARQMISRDVKTESDCVNIVYESVIASNRDRNHRVLKRLLDALGVRINCRFLCETNFDAVTGFLRAPWNIMARLDSAGIELRDFLQTEYGCRFLPGSLPVGFNSTARWIEEIGTLFGCTGQAALLIQEQQKIYQQQLEQMRPLFAGRRLFLFVTQTNSAWLYELAQDLGFDIVKTVVYGQEMENNPSWNQRFSAAWTGDKSTLANEIRTAAPDFVLTNDLSAIPGEISTDMIPENPDIGFLSGIRLAKRWESKMQNQLKGAWSDDARLFEKYYT